MPRRSVLIATENKKAIELITTYFQDTESIPTIIRKKGDLPALSLCAPDLLFMESDWMDKRVSHRLNQMKVELPQLKCFALGMRGQGRYNWDAIIDFPVDEKGFQRAVFAKIGFPNPVKLLIVDDESEVLDMLEDYFENRKAPQFRVRRAMNGVEGFKLVKEDTPHCMILDIKMPVRSGVELFRDLRSGGYNIPTVIFIDSTAADDITEIRKWGMPVFVEKGGAESSMLEMLTLVKKIVAFS